jgi:RNA polymerase sigma factor (sigma-70 family)
MAGYDADLDLARRCADGDERAWERFVLEYRPLLYRAADALDPSGGARDLADSLYADLYGLKEQRGVRQSLLGYYHGRSSLATWLRAVLAQRFVDGIRAERRIEPLPDEQTGAGEEVTRLAMTVARDPNPERRAYLSVVRRALRAAIARLSDRDRLRLSLYYREDLTLAQTARALGEHEGTASRQLARTRRELRSDVERQLRDDAGFTAAQTAECFASASEDAGHLDLEELFDTAVESKKRVADRSL